MFHTDFLLNETEAMHARLRMLQPLAMTIPMVKSASISDRAFAEVSNHFSEVRKKLDASLTELKLLLTSAAAESNSPSALNTKFSSLKLKFNFMLDQLDIYADVLTQRSEQITGTCLRGLDIFAEDGLTPCKRFVKTPPLMVYLERGHGAAIRRAKTRLPGGDLSPVAVIQVPRERMIGCGIASSLIHEVGHQAAELIGLTTALKEAIRAVAQSKTKNQKAWVYLERWVSEMVADLWAIAQLGVTATQGLMGVVSLPSFFQFRFDMDDPHPAPFIRVMLSCKLGQALFPDPQWSKLEQMWTAFYSPDKLADDVREDVLQLMEELPEFINVILNLRLSSLDNKKLVELFPIADRQPAILRKLYHQFKTTNEKPENISPVLMFAILGQAKSDLQLTAKQESKMLQFHLMDWAVQTLN